MQFQILSFLIVAFEFSSILILHLIEAAIFLHSKIVREVNILIPLFSYPPVFFIYWIYNQDPKKQVIYNQDLKKQAIYNQDLGGPGNPLSRLLDAVEFGKILSVCIHFVENLADSNIPES